MPYVSILDLVNHLAVFIGLFGTLLVLLAIVSYLGQGADDPRVLNPKFGIASHVYFLRGGSLLLLCWILKLVVILIDPSMPVLGPSFMWRRMSREEGFYDDSFYNAD